MNKLIFLKSLIVLLLLCSSCTLLTGDSDYRELRFEKETYIVYDRTMHTYRSQNFISILPKEDIDMNMFFQYLKATGLQLVTPYSHNKTSMLDLSQIKGQSPIVLLLPSKSDLSQFYSYSDNLHDGSFAINPFIVYSLPAYTYDINKSGWYYPTNVVFVKPATEDFSADELSEQFNLEYISKISQINLYVFEDNHFLHGSPYELAKRIFESGDYEYVVPSSYREIIRH